jgi:glycerol kinase
MQFQADILGIPIIRPQILETTALGAAYLAGLAVGYWDGYEEIRRQWKIDKTFEPRMGQKQVEELTGRWKEAVERAKGWIKPH